MRRDEGARWPDINHSDDELLYLSYYPLLILEKDPARRRLLVREHRPDLGGVEGEQSIRPERIPFYNFIYGATTGRRCDVDEARDAPGLALGPGRLDHAELAPPRRLIRNAPGIHRHTTQLDRVLSRPSAPRPDGTPALRTPTGGARAAREDDGVAWTRRLLAGRISRLPLAGGMIVMVPRLTLSPRPRWGRLGGPAPRSGFPSSARDPRTRTGPSTTELAVDGLAAQCGDQTGPPPHTSRPVKHGAAGE